MIHIFGVRNDSKVFHNYYEKYYTNFFFPKLKELGVKQIIQLGDLFDRRKYINFQTLTEARKYFFQPMYDNDIDMHTLLGNHDIFWKESVSVNSPELLLADYGNITVVKEPTTIEQWNMDLIPWICKENQNDVINFINESKSYVCCGHFELSGYIMIKNVAPHHDGLSDKILENVVSSYKKGQQPPVTFIDVPYLGFTINTMTPDTQKHLGLHEPTQGIRIQRSVYKDIKNGDILMEFDGYRVDSFGYINDKTLMDGQQKHIVNYLPELICHKSVPVKLFSVKSHKTYTVEMPLKIPTLRMVYPPYQEFDYLS
ncbi:hypothetical protein EBU71_22795, partial [bacterium]|nr:hypothetical protein [Candidatus Elulimicrobium humile]